MSLSAAAGAKPPSCSEKRRGQTEEWWLDSEPKGRGTEEEEEDEDGGGSRVGTDGRKEEKGRGTERLGKTMKRQEGDDEGCECRSVSVKVIRMIGDPGHRRSEQPQSLKCFYYFCWSLFIQATL